MACSRAAPRPSNRCNAFSTMLCCAIAFSKSSCAHAAAYSGCQYSSPRRGYISMACHPTANAIRPCAMKWSGPVDRARAGVFAGDKTPRI